MRRWNVCPMCCNANQLTQWRNPQFGGVTSFLLLLFENGPCGFKTNFFWWKPLQNSHMLLLKLPKNVSVVSNFLCQNQLDSCKSSPKKNIPSLHRLHRLPEMTSGSFRQDSSSSKSPGFNGFCFRCSLKPIITVLKFKGNQKKVDAFFLVQMFPSGWIMLNPSNHAKSISFCHRNPHGLDPSSRSRPVPALASSASASASATHCRKAWPKSCASFRKTCAAWRWLR